MLVESVVVEVTARRILPVLWECFLSLSWYKSNEDGAKMLHSLLLQR